MDEPGAKMGRAIFALVVVAMLVGSCAQSPTAPDRSGPITITVTCQSAAGTPRTECSATVSCGLYGCPAGTPADITATAVWTVEDPAVARSVGPGVIERVAPGDTTVKASQTGIGYNYVPISVFPGTPPLQTYVLSGAVVDGSSPAHSALDGVTVEILDGLVAGRRATSGVAPPFMPGYWAPTSFFRSGDYEFFGVPNGTYRLRASKPGYVTQERETNGSNIQFVLERAE